MAKMERRFFPCEVKAFNDNDLTVDHFISTETPDRSNDEMDPDGMLLDGVPSVLKQHGQDADTGSEPIARCLSLVPAVNEKGARGIKARTQYYDGSHLTPPDNTGRRLYEKAKGGFMPYWSIGFIPFESVPKAQGGRRVKTWLCVEYSQVGVPDNVEAKSFNPADGTETLSGSPEHRTIDGIDIDARYASAYVKAFKDVNGEMLTSGHLFQMRPVDGMSLTRFNANEGEHDGKHYNVIYQKSGDSWIRHAFQYPADVWAKADAEKHCASVCDGKFFPADALETDPVEDKGRGDGQGRGGERQGDGGAAVCVCPKCGAEASHKKGVPCTEMKCPKCGAAMQGKDTKPKVMKSLTTSLEFNNEYHALADAMQAFVSDIMYRAEPISDRDLKAMCKEYGAYVEKHVFALVAIVRQMTEEQSQKCFTDIMERKTVSAADPAPAGNGAVEPPESTPPAATPINGGSVEAPPAAQAAQGTEGEMEGLIPEVDFDVVEGTAADSSQSDPETEATVEDTIEFDPDELKSIVRTACAESVRASIKKLRGRMD